MKTKLIALIFATIVMSNWICFASDETWIDEIGKTQNSREVKQISAIQNITLTLNRLQSEGDLNSAEVWCFKFVVAQELKLQQKLTNTIQLRISKLADGEYPKDSQQAFVEIFNQAINEQFDIVDKQLNDWHSLLLKKYDN